MQTRTPLDFASVTIACERIQLVPISEQYASIIFQEFTDEIARLMIPATPKHIDEVHNFIQTCVQSMAQNTDLTFAILNKNDGDFLGVCALHGAPTPHQPTLGIWLKKTAHGNRYGQEAIQSLANWARQNLIYDYMIYPCDKDNIPSRKVAEKLHGVIFKTGKVQSMSGYLINEVAYKIL